jgi:tRNA(Ile)-lysidine synthase
LGQDHRDDASNAQRSFTRNRLRHDLLPQLAREYNPAVVEALVRLGQLSGEAQEVLNALATNLRDAAATRVSAGWRIDLPPLHGQPRYLVREMFVRLWQQSGWPRQAMGLAEWDSLADLAAADPAPRKLELPGNIEVERVGDVLTVSRASR